MKKILFSALAPFLLLILVPLAGAAQSKESLTNSQIVEMSQVGLEKETILKKINDSASVFDVSTPALVALKKAGVADEVIRLMLEKSESQKLPDASTTTVLTDAKNYSDSVSTDAGQFDRSVPTGKEALLRAKTVAIVKSSLNPSRQALEKALLKRADWRGYNLTIIRYKEESDLYLEIGRIPFSWLTHRYVFRLYDRRSGAVLAAGETTSWGSLAENLAREIVQKMKTVAAT
jgi:hypothetical protein